MEGAPAVRVLGRYALHGAIASGGMATVHFGRLLGAAGFARTVAIKRLHPQYAGDPEFVSMFVDEARLASRIRSPHVVPTLDVVATAGELFLVMEYVAGESLGRLMRPGDGRERVPLGVAVAVMAGALRGLHAAHEAHNERGEPLGIVHRDVSPQNVIVGSDGLARVLDFGVAKAAGRLQTTREGQLKGKLSYMGPEQLRGDPVTRATDVYAASVVLWELLVGERLFRADNEGALVTRVMQGNVTRPSRATSPGRPRDEDSQRVLERLDPIVMRGIDRDPARRFETARDMAVALEECVAAATAAQVGDWVERLAGPVLVERAAQIAAMESGGHVEDAEAIAGEPTMAEAIAPAAPPGQSTQASSISVSANVRDRGPGRARVRTIAAIAVGAALLGVSVLVYLGARSPSVAAPAVTASAMVATVPSGPAEAPAPAQSAPSAASTDVLDAGPSSTTAAPSAAPAPTTPRRVPRPSTRANDCNPPFTWDSQGKKHYKASCL